MDRQRDCTTTRLKEFLCRIARTVDRDGLLILRDPALGEQICVPARALLQLCAAGQINAWPRGDV